MTINRLFFICAFLALASFEIKAQTNKRVSIKANSNKIDIRDGQNFTKGNWTLAPELKPDVYKTDVVSNSKKKITFYTDIDSISFEVERNKVYDFNIIINSKDTCWTQINTIPNFQFSNTYIKKNKGKFSFEVPEVQELVHIIMALTPSGIKDKNMVEHEGDYYKSVMKYFDKYKNEPIVLKIDEFLQKGGYSVLKMDACGYIFHKNKIVKDGTYDKLSWDGSNYAEPFISEIENFAQKSNFRKFYSANKKYYNGLIKEMEKQTPIKKQWDWLEKKFNIKYDNYRITFSPLVNGSHSTNKFMQDDFKQTVMFICGPIENSKHNAKVVEGLMTRVVFTEIDHNYVNPVSDIYQAEIDKALGNLSKWATKDATSNYGNAYSVFNEYMTWGVFTLYAKENFSNEDFEVINERVEKQMSEWRGFTKFKEFNRMLMDLYRKENNNIETLYPNVIKWCEEQ
jgi:hypothetical protein